LPSTFIGSISGAWVGGVNGGGRAADDFPRPRIVFGNPDRSICSIAAHERAEIAHAHEALGRQRTQHE